MTVNCHSLSSPPDSRIFLVDYVPERTIGIRRNCDVLDECNACEGNSGDCGACVYLGTSYNQRTIILNYNSDTTQYFFLTDGTYLSLTLGTLKNDSYYGLTGQGSVIEDNYCHKMDDCFGCGRKEECGWCDGVCMLGNSTQGYPSLLPERNCTSSQNIWGFISGETRSCWNCPNVPYYGSECDSYDCYGVAATNQYACNGQGFCDAPDVCSCAQGYDGKSCGGGALTISEPDCGEYPIITTVQTLFTYTPPNTLKVILLI